MSLDISPLTVFPVSLSNAAIYNFDNKPEVHQIHFDLGFSVLFDNGANVSIGIHKDDFIELTMKPGSISGVGSAKAKGIGTIHWKLRTDSGKYIDVFIRDALYLPSMDLRIISVAHGTSHSRPLWTALSLSVHRCLSKIS